MSNSNIMKTLFIEARRKNLKLEENTKKFISGLGKISILYSIQYKSLAEEIKKYALLNKKKVILFQQVLGCSNPKLKDSTIILVGSGRFHAVNIALRTGFPIYILEQDKISQVTKQEIEELEKKKKTALSKFYMSGKIGILVSTKPGQEKMKQALKLKEKLEKQSKKVYLFVADTFPLSELENFSLPIYINTACPGISFDSDKIVNYEDITV
jgi:2-(3-amino-3-carboxypropyl)histidine synthase